MPEGLTLGDMSFGLERKGKTTMDLILETMDDFSKNLHSILDMNLLSVILFGSAVLGDFTPDKGDLDFIVAVQDNLSDDDCSRIFALHDRMRAGEMGKLAAQLEGTYYPLAIIRDPKNAVANGCYVGTGRKGWRRVSSCQNSLMDYAIIRRYGTVCYGMDILQMLYKPLHNELLDEIKMNLAKSIEASATSSSIEYALAMFHWGTRALCYALTGQLFSKTKAAEWYASTFPNDHWTQLVLHAKDYRHPLTNIEIEQMNPAIIEELNGFLYHIAEMLFSEKAKQNGDAQ